jgi:hypothetical protein
MGSAWAADDAALRDELAGIEQSLWTAWSKNDAGVFKEHMWKDGFLITSGGRTGYEEMSTDPGGDCEVKGFSLSDYQLTRLGDGAAILTYRAVQEATCSDHTLPSPVMASSVYVKDGGKWKSAMYQETPLSE